MADEADTFIEQIEDALHMGAVIKDVSLPDLVRRTVIRLLDQWKDEIAEAAKEEGEQTGYDQALKDERICGDDTMADLELGISMMKKGDSCAPVYLDRALRDLGSSYY